MSAVKRKHYMVAVLAHDVAHTKFVRTDCIAFKTNAEYFRFDTVHNVFDVLGSGKNLIVRIFKAQSRRKRIYGEFLISVGRPVVDDARLARSFGKISAYPAASDTVSYPELPHAFVPCGQSSFIGKRVRKISRVKIKTKTSFDCPIRPLCKMLGFQLVPFDEFVGFGVVCMNIDFLFAGNIFENHVEIGAKFLGISRPARVVSGRLYAAAQCRRAFFKTYNVVALPTMHRDGRGVAYLNSLVYVYADFSEDFFCIFVTFFDRVHKISSINLR